MAAKKTAKKGKSVTASRTCADAQGRDLAIIRNIVAHRDLSPIYLSTLADTEPEARVRHLALTTATTKAMFEFLMKAATKEKDPEKPGGKGATTSAKKHYAAPPFLSCSLSVDDAEWGAVSECKRMLARLSGPGKSES